MAPPIAPSIYSGAYALGYDDASMGRPVGVKPPWYGQPVYETHPHLLSQGEREWGGGREAVAAVDLAPR